MRRHLAAPANRITRFRFVHLLAIGKVLKDRFLDHFTAEQRAWRVGRGSKKLAGIDRSVTEDEMKFNRVNAMIKIETSTQLFDAPKIIKKARLIQFPINERSAYQFVEEAHAFSHALVDVTCEKYTCGGVEFDIRYAASMNHDDIGMFATDCEKLRREFTCSYIDERDGTNWDANVQIAHREALFEVYRLLDEQFADYAAAGLNVKGTFRTKDGVRILYTTIGTVKSGHFDTSSGNGALNREVAIQAILALPPGLRPALVKGLVMGDDYIAWLFFNHYVDPRELRLALDTAESGLGIDPSRGLFHDVRCASFISLGFYVSHCGRVIALPKIGRQLCRLFWTVTNLQGRDPRRLAAGIARAFYPLYSTYPPMRAFLKHHMQVDPLGVADIYLTYKWAEHGHTRLPAPINWAENHLVKYGEAALVLDFEGLFDGEQSAGLISHPIVDLMYRIDSADPAERRGCVSA